jgi:hypothetical protein
MPETPLVTKTESDLEHDATWDGDIINIDIPGGAPPDLRLIVSQQGKFNAVIGFNGTKAGDVDLQYATLQDGTMNTFRATGQDGIWGTQVTQGTVMVDIYSHDDDNKTPALIRQTGIFWDDEHALLSVQNAVRQTAGAITSLQIIPRNIDGGISILEVQLYGLSRS